MVEPEKGSTVIQTVNKDGRRYRVIVKYLGRVKRKKKEKRRYK